MKRKKRNSSEDKYNSLSLGLTFITVGLILFFTKGFLFSEKCSFIMTLAFIGIGGAFLSVDVEKITGVKTAYMGVGALFIGAWGILLYCYDRMWVHIVGVLVLIYGVFGIYMSVVDIVRKITSIKNLQEKIKKLVLMLTNVATLVGLIVQIFAKVQ